MTKISRRRWASFAVAAVVVACVVCGVAAASAGWLSADTNPALQSTVQTTDSGTDPGDSDSSAAESSSSAEEPAAATTDQAAEAGQDAVDATTEEQPVAADAAAMEDAAAEDAAGTAIESTDAFDSSASSEAQQPAAAVESTISVSVSIDSSAAHAYNANYPSSMGSATVQIDDGASVYDALVATGVTVGGSSNYVRKINGLGEFDCGQNSGWLYYVNGAQPGYGCGSYALHGGESITWLYTADYTKS